MNPVYVIMGVSGSGKTTLGSLWAKEQGLPFFDADDFHPEANVQKMASGQALTDLDREPWLNILAEKIGQWSNSTGAVLACSALKEAYREVLNAQGVVQWIYLHGSYETILERMQARSDHYMPAELLQSQFDALEEPNYGIRLEITDPPQQLIQQLIRSKNTTMSNTSIGLMGLGVMGKSLARNIAGQGFSINVYNRNTEGEEQVVPDFIEQYGNDKIEGFTSVDEFVQSLATPRTIILMVPSSAVDLVLDGLIPHLEPGDLVLDCGNSYFEDSQRREQLLSSHGMQFYGVGVSGGEKGALLGPSIMIGGAASGYEQIQDLMEAMAAKDKDGKACASLVGPGGSGHFVKMVHNGIEYAEMQLLAELYDLLRQQLDNEQIAQLFESWMDQGQESFLLQITIEILRYREDEEYLMDKILDQAANKGTGSWSSQLALQMGSVNTLMSASVFARYISSFKTQRTARALEQNTVGSLELDPNKLIQAYAMARMINHHQGMELIRIASEAHGWNIDLAETCRIWTKGCIIQSQLMEELVQEYNVHKDLLDSTQHRDTIQQQEPALKKLLIQGLEARVPLPCFGASWNYWVGMTTATGPANLIQAQRDFFGGHTYQRNDRPGIFTTNWNNHG